MKNFTIATDMDDTIEDLCLAWVNGLNKRFDKNVKYSDIRKWEIAEYYPDIPSEYIFSLLCEEDFWKTVKPKKDAIKYLSKLKDEGDRIIIVTASSYKTLYYKFTHCLLKYFPFNEKDVIVAFDKTLIKSDFMIDDNPKNLTDPDKINLLFTANHNLDFNTKSTNIRRVNNWKQIYDIITLERNKYES